MTSPDLEALKTLVELAKKATPGPWQTWSDGGAPLRVIAAKDGAWNGELCKMSRRAPDDGAWDGEFIASARNAIPALERLLAGQREPVASSECPICGVDTPHNHSDEDIEYWVCAQALRFGYRATVRRATEPRAEPLVDPVAWYWPHSTYRAPSISWGSSKPSHYSPDGIEQMTGWEPLFAAPPVQEAGRVPAHGWEARAMECIKLYDAAHERVDMRSETEAGEIAIDILRVMLSGAEPASLGAARKKED